MESEILGFGIRNTDQGMRNPANDWSPESLPLTKNPESRTWNSESTAWNPEFKTVLGIQGCGPLGWFGSGSVIRDHSDHGRSNEQMNPLWTRILRFIWSTMIRVILMRIIPKERTPRPFWILDSTSKLSRIPYFTNKNFPNSGIRTPLHRMSREFLRLLMILPAEFQEASP